MPPRDVAGQASWSALEAAPARATSSGSRSRARASSTSTSRPTWLHEVLRGVVAQGERYGHGDALAGQRINLEFVSANPTGPLHAGGGRWVAVGDALANLLAAQGAEVHREYYLNDAGNQLDTFARVAASRGTAASEPPEDGYQGEYLVEMADAHARRARRRRSPRSRRASGATATSVAAARRTTSGGSACTSTPGSRSARCTSAGEVARGARRPARRAASTYEHDGATWLRATDFGDQRDRVLVKSDGSTTYLCNDLAYHATSSTAGWEHLIDIWGADHHGQVKSLQAGHRGARLPRRASPRCCSASS